MSVLVKKEMPQTISPAVHLEFIQNQAGLPEAESVGGIEAYHRALFLHHHAAELEKYEQQACVHQDRLAHLENRLQETTAKLTGLDALVPVDLDGQADIKPSSPWNWWDVAMFAT